MKKIVLVIAALALAGCVPPKSSYKSLVSPGMIGVIKKQSYIDNYKSVISSAIMDRVVNLDKWAGKKCSLKVKFDGDGVVKEVNYIEGDDKFCAAMSDAIYSATFPAFTSPEFATDHEIRFDFKPVKAAPVAADDDLLGDLSSGANAPRSGNDLTPDKIAQTVSKLQAILKSNIDDWEQYKDKMCTISIGFDNSNHINAVRSLGGDPKLCQALLMSAVKVKYFDIPKDQVSYFNNSPLDFKP